MGRSARKETKMKVPLLKIHWKKLDKDSIYDIMSRSRDWTIGGEATELENAVSKYVGVKYGVAFNSGTSALHALMLAYGIKGGDEVIVPSFSFIATSNCVLFVGAKPVFADIEDKYFGLDPQDVEKKITRKTKAIIAVHYGGSPCRITELRKLAKRKGLILIEDACESLGSKYLGQMVGSFGNSAVFSFCQNKIVTAGEGGMVTTNDKKLADHGKVNGKFVSLGYNWRMSNITAALALSQFSRIEQIIKKRIANAEHFTRKIFGEPFNERGTRNVYQLYTIRIGKDRNKLQKLLTKNGIGNKIYFEPIHLTPYYKSLGYHEGSLPVTEQIAKEVITLPMFPGLTHKEMDYIAKIVCSQIY